MELPKVETDDGDTIQPRQPENMIEIEVLPYPLFQYLNSEECNIHNICRICLSINEPVLFPLFSAKEHCVLATMLMAISEVQINPDDGLPSKICPRCQTEVMSYYEFKMKCVKSDNTLKSILNGEFITNKKISNNNDFIKTKMKLERDNNKSEDITNTISGEPQQGDDTGLNYLEHLRESMSDDEAFCIVQDTIDNQKEITMINSEPNIIMKTKEEKALTKKKRQQCTFCPKKFYRVLSLAEHVKKRHPNVTPESPYPCDRCKEAFDSEFDLKVHSMLHEQGAVWKCTVCQKEFNGRTALRRHISRHMRRRRFACSECSATFVEMYALRRHSHVHTGCPTEKKHACTQCDKRFSWTGALKAHMSTHGAERSSVCAVCGAAFASQRLLNSHQRVHSSDKPYSCPHCEKRFRHESTRNTHVRTHTGERPYVCAQCGKAFIQHSNMTLHMRTHTGEKPYQCTMCDRKFSSSSTLTAHLRSHTGDRPYSCEVCGKRFARSSFKSHMLLHGGERAHPCPAPACRRTFITPHRLKEHYRLHTGEKPYECADCPLKYTTKSQLIKHVKKHDKKKKAGHKGIRLMPVTVFDTNIRPVTNAPIKPDQDRFVGSNENKADPNLSIVQETPNNSVNYVNDINYANEVNSVTVNEGEVSISASSATLDGTTVKLYQYDQSLLQIHSGGGQLTISRISSKMTTNF